MAQVVIGNAGDITLQLEFFLEFLRSRVEVESLNLLLVIFLFCISDNIETEKTVEHYVFPTYDAWRSISVEHSDHSVLFELFHPIPQRSAYFRSSDTEI
jgi:hypothetical protein